MNLGTASVIRANSRHLPLADNSVDLVVTSPPYFALRSYQDGGEHYAGQIGDEPTPDEFVSSLLEVTAECVRVLKPSGSLWVNLGDKYAQDQERSRNGNGNRTHGENFASGSVLRGPTVTLGRKSNGVPRKSLIGIPWRYALRCIDDLGLILRAEVIWSKPNGLPESVTDRVRRSHEQWFHFVLRPRYFSAVDEIRSPTSTPRRAGFTPPSRPALGPELVATVRTDDGPSVTRGWCQLGALKQPVRAAMTGDAQGLQVAELVGFSLRVEGAERDYVIDLQSTGGPALDAPMAVAVKSALADLAPTDSAPCSVTSRPSGVLVSGAVVGDALRRAEVLGLECAPIAHEGIAARITLDLNPGRATLLVWDAFASRHPVILPQRSDPLGKLPGSVWEIPTEPLRVPEHLGIDHFAAFPTSFPKRIIAGWSPAGVCVECGEGRRPIAQRVTGLSLDGRKRPARDSAATWNESDNADNQWGGERGFDRGVGATIIGYTCGCTNCHNGHPFAPGVSVDHTPGESDPRWCDVCGEARVLPPTRPAVVLDPFGGTGTTAMVAKALGRHGISVDMSADYCRLAEWRTNDRDQLAKVLGVAKAEKQPDDQLSIFDLGEPA